MSYLKVFFEMLMNFLKLGESCFLWLEQVFVVATTKGSVRQRRLPWTITVVPMLRFVNFFPFHPLFASKEEMESVSVNVFLCLPL